MKNVFIVCIMLSTLPSYALNCMAGLRDPKAFGLCFGLSCSTVPVSCTNGYSGNAQNNQEVNKVKFNIDGKVVEVKAAPSMSLLELSDEKYLRDRLRKAGVFVDDDSTISFHSYSFPDNVVLYSDKHSTKAVPKTSSSQNNEWSCFYSQEPVLISGLGSCGMSICTGKVSCYVNGRLKTGAATCKSDGQSCPSPTECATSKDKQVIMKKSALYKPPMSQIKDSGAIQ